MKIVQTYPQAMLAWPVARVQQLSYLFAPQLSSQKGKDQKCQPVAYIASTIRNKDTYEKFLLALGEYRICKYVL
jgi:hypothetical protein